MPPKGKGSWGGVVVMLVSASFPIPSSSVGRRENLVPPDGCWSRGQLPEPHSP